MNTFAALLIAGLRVIDGDSMVLHLPPPRGAPAEIVRIRLEGVDTPETHRPGCKAERRKGRAATAFARSFIARGEVITITWAGASKWNNTLARIQVGGVDLSNALIEARHGRTYAGGKRRGWCP